MGPFFSRKIFYLLWGLRPRPKLPKPLAGTGLVSKIDDNFLFELGLGFFLSAF